MMHACRRGCRQLHSQYGLLAEEVHGLQFSGKGRFVNLPLAV